MARLTKKARRAAALKGWRKRKRNAGFSLRRKLQGRMDQVRGAVSRIGKSKHRGNPPKGYIPCKAVKITRNRGMVEIRVKR